MKLSIAALALAGVCAATAATAAPRCLDLREIRSAKSDDGKVMTFTLSNGKTVYNRLQGVCPGLRFNGFEWTIRGPQQVCEGQQSLRVLQSGEICVLGKFSDEKPKISTEKTG